MVGIGSRFGSAAKHSAKSGQTITEGILYFVFTALLIATFAMLFEILIPGTEWFLPGVERPFYISHDFYQSNRFWFNTFASLIALGVASMVIRWHRRTVRKRIEAFRKLG